MTTLLDLEGVTAFYGASQALFGVDLDIAEGEVVALMGRNGMGKTTTVRTISDSSARATAPSPSPATRPAAWRSTASPASASASSPRAAAASPP